MAGVHSAATPSPVATRLVSESDSTAASHTRTTIMNSPTSFCAARAAASATFCTSDEAEPTRYACPAENTSASVTSSDSTTPTVVMPSSSWNASTS